MRKFVTCLVVTGALAGVCSFASAQEEDKKKGPNPEQRFKQLDKNGDGSLTKEEFIGNAKEDKAKGAERRFAAADKNSDGKVTLEEYKAMPAGGKGKGKGKDDKK